MTAFKISDHVETTREYHKYIQTLNIATGKIFKKYHTGHVIDIHDICCEEIVVIELADGNLIDVASKYLKLRECTCGECDFCKKQMLQEEIAERSACI